MLLNAFGSKDLMIYIILCSVHLCTMVCEWFVGGESVRYTLRISNRFSSHTVPVLQWSPKVLKSSEVATGLPNLQVTLASNIISCHLSRHQPEDFHHRNEADPDPHE